MNKPLKIIGISIVLLFAFIGVVFSAVFIGMQFGIFNVRGSITERNQFFEQKTTPQTQAKTGNTSSSTTPKPLLPQAPCLSNELVVCNWNETREWSVIKGGLVKDSEVIHRVASETGVDPRLLAAIVVPEQTRFFTAEREVFKRYFEPLKILGSLSKFSLGVTGIKQETAVQIETYANDPTSVFYPGKQYAPLLAYPTEEGKGEELYARLSDAKNHYYSYLYTAIFVKEIEAQWRLDGYDISKNPGAIVTLFNLGFTKSHPNPKPHLGGSLIETGGKKYSYGELGQLFYDSEELSEQF